MKSHRVYFEPTIESRYSPLISPTAVPATPTPSPIITPNVVQPSLPTLVPPSIPSSLPSVSSVKRIQTSNVPTTNTTNTKSSSVAPQQQQVQQPIISKTLESLHDACEAGNLNEVSRLLSTVRPDGLCTILAGENGFVEIVSLLQSYKAPFTYKTKEGELDFMTACAAKNQVGSIDYAHVVYKLPITKEMVFAAIECQSMDVIKWLAKQPTKLAFGMLECLELLATHQEYESIVKIRPTSEELIEIIHLFDEMSIDLLNKIGSHYEVILRRL